VLSRVLSVACGWPLLRLGGLIAILLLGGCSSKPKETVLIEADKGLCHNVIMEGKEVKQVSRTFPCTLR
jgi:hypothetical protein